MPRIIMSCPETGEYVPTGHRTQDVDLTALTEPRSFRCPVCHQVHAWTGETARAETSRPSASGDAGQQAASA